MIAAAIILLIVLIGAYIAPSFLLRLQEGRKYPKGYRPDSHL
jgi:hypothetical protein